jgi:hypothetical protein
VASHVSVVYLPGIQVRCDVCRKAYRIVAPESWNDEPHDLDVIVCNMGWLILRTPRRYRTQVCPSCQVLFCSGVVVIVDLSLEEHRA